MWQHSSCYYIVFSHSLCACQIVRICIAVHMLFRRNKKYTPTYTERPCSTTSAARHERRPNKLADRQIETKLRTIAWVRNSSRRPCLLIHGVINTSFSVKKSYRRHVGGILLRQCNTSQICVCLLTVVCRHVARIVSWGELQCLGADIFRVLLYCYSLLAMLTVSVTEYTNIVVIK